MNKIKFATILIFAIVLTFGLSVSLQSLLAQWTAPTLSPPQGAPYPYRPIYATSTSDQSIDLSSLIIKAGNLTAANVAGLNLVAETTLVSSFNAGAYRFRVDSSGNVISGSITSSGNIQLVDGNSTITRPKCCRHLTIQHRFKRAYAYQ
jgi:hypothetical protein